MDVITRAKVLPKPGETVLGKGFISLRVGGKGLNQAIMATEALNVFKVGGNPEVTFEGSIGKDIFGAYAKTKLLENGVNATLHELKEVETGTGSIFMDDMGQNSIIVSLGANNELKATDEWIDANIVVCQLEVPPNTARHAFLNTPKDALRILNVAPAPAAKESAHWYEVQNLIKLVDIVIANEVEAEQMNLVEQAPTKTKDKNHMRISEEYPKTKAVIITRGEKGFRLVQRSALSKIDIPGTDDLPVDAVGAGDCFVAYFAAAMLLPNASILASAILANQAAGSYVARQKPEMTLDDMLAPKHTKMTTKEN